MIASCRRAELNGILACFPRRGDDPNHIPVGLLPPNGTHQPPRTVFGLKPAWR